MVSLGILQRFKIDLWMALKVKEQELPWDINYGCACIVEIDVGTAFGLMPVRLKFVYDDDG